MKNPFERTLQEKHPLKDLAVDYLNTQDAIDAVKRDDQNESERRGTMFGTFDKKEREKDAKRSAEIIREL